VGRLKLASWSTALALLALGCYPDSSKIRNTTVVGGAPGTGGTIGGGIGGSAGASDAAAGSGGTMVPRDSGPGVDLGPLLPPTATADNCTDFGIAWCEKNRQCLTRDVESLGGAAVCPARMKIWCENILAAPPDSNWTPANFKTCITSWSALTCDEWTDFDLEILKGPSCFVPGKRGEGAGCWSFAQCGSGECLGDTACGRCRPRIPADGACMFDSDCQRGLVCGQMKCVVPMNLGGACADARPCRRSLLCRGGACRPRAQEGESCDDHQDCAGGLLCNFTKGTCGLAVVSPARCSSREPDGTVLYCAGGTTCDQTNQMCVANAGDGQACVEEATPDCLWPAFCAGGTCRIARPVDCPAVPVSPDGGN
jgi:hypothetical protein